MDLITPTIPGLVWAYQFQPGKAPCRRLAPDAGFDEMAGRDGFFWLHLNLADQRVAGFLETVEGLDPAARASLTTHETHPSIVVDEKSLYGTLVDFQREFDKETRDFGWLHFAVSDRFIITTRLQPLHSVDRLKAAVDKNSNRYLTPSHVFEGLVAEFQRSLINLVMETTEELNAIEDLVYDSETRDERRRLAPLRRTVVRLHRHLRTVLTLMRRASAADDDEMPDGFEDVASRLMGRLEAVDHDVYALQERARLLHEEIDSKLSSETNRHLYILSLMTAFLLPPSLVTGFFGMNTDELPFTVGTGGTMAASIFIVISVVLAWFVLKRARIL
ncbi:transporter [Rhizobium pusense]|jgi:zinc transporter|uniref:Transporter n=4 Tax=Bacteria TaxID=2 RepID=A0A1L9CIU2_9HYPH|nr:MULTISPECIES: transporter [Rhizobium/Agrobacterium group]AMD61031.1 transporter [Agrobacterium tumefaciens]ANV24697.1 transporter [Rhizobium sp. S41]AUC09076.1 transporter [Rhizobium sp. Y9]EKJ94034.1 divalent cation transporter [Bradyrhizobium lupini HPC(L)]KGE82801.1 transporter [Rhizobium sp. H41]KIV68579.1 Magnesium and cobalt transport protein CorA [Rhizobium sp. UR51a]MBB2904262.1 zinc transporter [Rhizobium sp. RAS22]MDP9732473.1 zinc transporter [Rhizobium sp. SORGH_AS_0285]MDP9